MYERVVDGQTDRPAAGAEHVETAIIGSGQAGLAMGYHLARRGRPFLILDANERAGDSWRQRWDSLRLFTPARYDGLPGWRFPAPPWSFPTRDEMADYLDAYAARFELPRRSGVRVDRLCRDGDRYLLRAGERWFQADAVVVASGAWQRPKVPDFAAQLDPAIQTLHSSQYRGPAQLLPGGVLVVGAGNSGAEIALEAAREHDTVLSGRDTGHIPFRIEGRPARVVTRVLWLLATRVLTLDTPMGRKMAPAMRSHGGPLVRVKPEDLAAAKVRRVLERTLGVRDGRPMLDGGRVLDVANVIWCTGFGPDLGWVDVPVTGPDGWPRQERGVVPSSPGLYFLGLPFQRAFSSALVGGVGRDAEYLAGHLADHLAARRPGRRSARPADELPVAG